MRWGTSSTLGFDEFKNGRKYSKLGFIERGNHLFCKFNFVLVAFEFDRTNLGSARNQSSKP